MRQREAGIDCATGQMTQVRQHLAEQTSATTDLIYFANGNLKQVVYPPNKHDERYQIRYAYDPVVATHVTQITDSFSYVSTATYNYKYGSVATSVDLNNNPTTYHYDGFGRMATVYGPYQAELSTPTIHFEYHHDAQIPWALTQHIDDYRSATDTIDTVLFIDGIGRVLQTKKDATLYQGEDLSPEDQMVVSGRVTFDFMGRTIASYYPVTEPLGTPGIFNPAFDSVQPTHITYDVLDRTTQITIPDNTSTSTAYGFGLDRAGTPQFMTIATDANGIQKKSFSNVRDLITSIQETNTLPDGTLQEIWTSYEYDALSQLIEVSDDQQYVTQVVYDHLGRRTIIDSPDSGRTELFYDLASNPVAQITANLRQIPDKQIVYDYEYNRIASISYPDFTENNVTYTYGAPGVRDNRAGRITYISSEAGIEERFYGKLGEIVKVVKTIDSDTTAARQSYTTETRYDTWGRLQQLTYPDGEVLTYAYDAGGKVRQVTGHKLPHTTEYLSRLEYDKFEQRAFLEMGNGVRTSYAYNADNRRLHNLQASQPNGQLFQNLYYDYDNVGNILSLTNDRALAAPGLLGGPTAQHFEYDELYRLTHATGTFSHAKHYEETVDSYTLAMQYDTLHNIVNKAQKHVITEGGDDKDTQRKTTYDWDYAYAGPRPHAPTEIGDFRYLYDANGNQVGWDDEEQDQARRIIWDEENRVQRIVTGDDDEIVERVADQTSDDAVLATANEVAPRPAVNEETADNASKSGTRDKPVVVTFKYDDGGERVLKRGAEDETAYINAYYVVRNRHIRTKHVYVGNTRLSSTLVQVDGTSDALDLVAAQEEAMNKGTEPPQIAADASVNDESANGDIGPIARTLYFYHSDHLGSTNYVTNDEGDIFQHLEYFPFGETWVEQTKDFDGIPYLFTAKELDEETGLYYFGARYYDPRTSVWQSTDPALGGLCQLR